MMQVDRLRPYIVAGACGALLIALLYGVPLFLGWWSGPGGWGIPLLLFPGMLAAHLAMQRGMGFAPVREGALAGLVVAAFAGLLETYATVRGVLEIDWARYATQVGQEVADGVHQAVVPLTVITVVLSVGVSFAGCLLLGAVGAAVYTRFRGLLSRAPE